MILDGAFEMFDWLKKKVAPPPPVRTEKTPRVAKVTKATEKTEKELATEAGEPYVAVLRMDVDPSNLHQGAFELDWNEVFVARLVKAGYMMKKDDTDAEIEIGRAHV